VEVYRQILLVFFKSMLVVHEICGSYFVEFEPTALIWISL